MDRRWLLVKRVKRKQSTVDENVAVVSFRPKLRKNSESSVTSTSTTQVGRMR